MSENSEPVIDEKMPDRIIAYVDGYNLYYAVNGWGGQEKPDLVKYHLWNLIRECLRKINLRKTNREIESENLEEIKFYTAPPIEGGGPHNLDHYKQWTDWQMDERDVEVIEGVHRSRGNKYKEKQSDVNLAVGMLSGAFQNPYNRLEIPYNTAVLISNDTDYCGLILKCLQLKRYVLVLRTASTNSIKDELLREGNPHSSECEHYIKNGMLDFYKIKKQDVEACPDEEYIERYKDNN